METAQAIPLPSIINFLNTPPVTDHIISLAPIATGQTITVGGITGVSLVPIPSRLRN